MKLSDKHRKRMIFVLVLCAFAFFVMWLYGTEYLIVYLIVLVVFKLIHGDRDEIKSKERQYGM